MKSWAPSISVSAKDTTITIQDEEGPYLFATNAVTSTIMLVNIKTNGHPSLRGHIIRSLIIPNQVLLLNYGRADTWYFESDSFDAAGLNNTT